MNYVGEALSIQVRTAEFYRRNGGLVALQDVEWMQASVKRSGNSDALIAALRCAELMVERGETYYVSADICSSLNEIAPTLPDNFQLSSEYLPSLIGFALLDSPDKREALGWLSYTDADLTQFSFFSFSEDFGHWMPHMSWTWPHRSTIASVAQQDRDDPVEGASFTPIGRFIGTLFSFTRQRILVTKQQHAPRAVQRRMPSPTMLSPVIQVVKLRAAESSHVENGPTKEPREWAHRWVVRGHWRQQWYPSLQAHQPKWIAPYVKGPEDKPLKAPRAQVFAVVR